MELRADAAPPLFLAPFSVVGLDIQDEMGRHEVGHIDNSMKVALNHGAGCRFEGEFAINKVTSRRTRVHTIAVSCEAQLVFPASHASFSPQGLQSLTPGVGHLTRSSME